MTSTTFSFCTISAIKLWRGECYCCSTNRKRNCSMMTWWAWLDLPGNHCEFLGNVLRHWPAGSEYHGCLWRCCWGVPRSSGQTSKRRWRGQPPSVSFASCSPLLGSTPRTCSSRCSEAAPKGGKSLATWTYEPLNIANISMLPNEEFGSKWCQNVTPPSSSPGCPPVFLSDFHLP